MSLARSKTNLKEILNWCREHFGDITQVHYPAIAELHRVSYDDKVTGIVVFYFTDPADYFFFMLRWQ